MNRADHYITICTSCRDKGSSVRPGPALIDQLRAALGSEGYNIDAVACMAGCGHPCAVAFQAGGKASYLFGDISGSDVEDLVKFARQYALLRDGWCSSVDRPGKLRKSTLARIPALMREGLA